MMLNLYHVLVLRLMLIFFNFYLLLYFFRRRKNSNRIMAKRVHDSDVDAESRFWTTGVPDFLHKKFWSYKEFECVFGGISLARVLEEKTGGLYTRGWKSYISPAIVEQCKAIVDGIEAWNQHYWSTALSKPTLQQVKADVAILQQLKRVNQRYSAQIKYCVLKEGLEDVIRVRHMYHRIMSACGKDSPLAHSQPSRKAYGWNQKRKTDKGQLFRYISNFVGKEIFIIFLSICILFQTCVSPLGFLG